LFSKEEKFFSNLFGFVSQKDGGSWVRTPPGWEIIGHLHCSAVVRTILGEFWTLGHCLLLGSFIKMTEVAQIFGLLLYKIKIMLKF
jgi:hypothetical protein